MFARQAGSAGGVNEGKSSARHMGGGHSADRGKPRPVSLVYCAGFSAHKPRLRGARVTVHRALWGEGGFRASKGAEVMAATAFQQQLCKLIATSRRRSGESYVAGDVALDTLLQAPRISRDIDLFHDTDEALRVSWECESCSGCVRAHSGSFRCSKMRDSVWTSFRQTRPAPPSSIKPATYIGRPRTHCRRICRTGLCSSMQGASEGSGRRSRPSDRRRINDNTLRGERQEGVSCSTRWIRLS